MTQYIAIAFSSIFVSNIILSQFLGLCPFLGVSKKKSAALSMGAAVTIVITLSAMISWSVYEFVLIPYEIEYLRTIVFILVIAAFVQLLEMVIKKFSPPIYQALGVYLPLITTNCAVLGVALLVIGDNKLTHEPFTFLQATVFALSISIGYALVIFLFSAIREEMYAYEIPENYKGIGIALITAFIMAMSFMGFGGIV